MSKKKLCLQAFFFYAHTLNIKTWPHTQNCVCWFDTEDECAHARSTDKKKMWHVNKSLRAAAPLLLQAKVESEKKCANKIKLRCSVYPVVRIRTFSQGRVRMCATKQCVINVISCLVMMWRQRRVHARQPIKYIWSNNNLFY